MWFVFLGIWYFIIWMIDFFVWIIGRKYYVCCFIFWVFDCDKCSWVRNSLMMVNNGIFFVGFYVVNIIRLNKNSISIKLFSIIWSIWGWMICSKWCFKRFVSIGFINVCLFYWMIIYNRECIVFFVFWRLFVNYIYWKVDLKLYVVDVVNVEVILIRFVYRNYRIGFLWRYSRWVSWW